MPDFKHWAKRSPSQRAYHFAEEHAKNWAAADSDVKQITAFISSYGMSVVETHAARRTITVSGTVAQMNRAFNVDLKMYEAPLPKSGRRSVSLT
jgi:kumamolisin